MRRLPQEKQRQVKTPNQRGRHMEIDDVCKLLPSLKKMSCTTQHNAKENTWLPNKWFQAELRLRLRRNTDNGCEPGSSTAWAADTSTGPAVHFTRLQLGPPNWLSSLCVRASCNEAHTKSTLPELYSAGRNRGLRLESRSPI